MNKGIYVAVFLTGLALSSVVASAKNKPDKAAIDKQRQAVENVNKTYEVDQKVVSTFKEVVGTIKPSAVPKQPRNVLIYGVSHGPHLFAIPTAKVILAALGKETCAYTAVVSDELANFEPEALKQFDAVCFVNTTGEVFNRPVDRQSFAALSEDERKRQTAHADRLVKNLTQYVRDGGGFFGIHAATDTLKQSPAYGEMIGGCFDGHPWSAGQTVKVRIEKPEHPLCRDIFGRDGFSIADEIYQMKTPYARDKVTVLTSVVVEASDQPAKPLTREDKDYPLSWIKAYGKGRVFYSALGHNTVTFGNPLVLRHWLAGLQYVTGDLSVNRE